MAVFAAAALRIPERFRPGYGWAAMIGAASAQAWMGAMAWPQSWWGALALPLFSTIAWFIFRFFPAGKFHPAVRGMSLFAAFTAVSFLVASSAVATGETRFLRAFWISQPEYAVLTFVLWSWLMKTSENVAAITILPTNALGGILWPVGMATRPENETARYALWWRGFLNVMLGQLLFAIAMIGMNFIGSLRPENPFLGSWFTYPFFLLLIIGAINNGIGLVRMFGVPAPDGTRFVLFSRTPLEVWQRGSTYAYELILRFVFIPAYRASRSLLITAGACFVAVWFNSFLFHEIVVRKFHAWAVPALHSQQFEVTGILVMSFSWVLTWAVFLLMSSRFWAPRVRLARSGPKIWISVVLTHLCAASVMPLAQHWIAPAIGRLLTWGPP
ncbi:MAG: hypothetical protein A2X94_12155 [Bdellovibrionales bacterium GWB1_55_8]|nr:MAG: hypothetical protein A2X94_12155 [Bdellovibrionales bacterium GWB1_55_8]